MKTFILLFALFSFINPLFSQSWTWLNTAGQDVDDTDGAAKNLVKRIGEDGEGNIYIAGLFRDYITLGDTELDATEDGCHGCYDVFLSKLDPSGNYIWSRQMKGPNDLLYDMCVKDNGDIYLAGSYSNGSWYDSDGWVELGNGKRLPPPENNKHDGFLVKYNSEGICQWARSYGAAGVDFTLSIAPDRRGGLYMTGYFSDTVTFGSSTLISDGRKDFFLARLKANGFPEFAVQGGGIWRVEGLDVATDQEGNAYVLGSMRNTATFDGLTFNKVGLKDGFLLKYDPSGDLLWGQQIAGPGIDYMLDLDVNSEGQAFVSGQFEEPIDIAGTRLHPKGDYDGFIAKFDLAGRLHWAKRMGSYYNDRINAIQADAAGGCYISGTFAGSIDFGDFEMHSSHGSFDLCFYQLDAYGEVLWGQQSGGSGTEYCRDIHIDEFKHLYAGGYFIGETTFGELTANSKGHTIGTEDLFLAKLRQRPLATDDKSDYQTGSLYPNPASNHTTLQVPESCKTPIQLQLTDSNGKSLWISSEIQAGKTTMYIPLDHLSEGIYFLQIGFPDHQTVKKITVQR